MSLLDKIGKIAEKEEKKEKKLKTDTPKKTETKKTPTVTKKGRIFMFFGEEGTGKTYACVDLAKKFGKTLYIDTEWKADEIIDEQFPELQYDIKRPILDDNKKFSEIFREDSDIHIIIAQKINKETGERDDVTTTKYLMELKPKLLHFIKKGIYKCVVIDSVVPIWEYAYSEWLNRNKGRIRPNKFEYGEIETIKQEIVLPFVNFAKVYGTHLFLTGGTKGHFVNDKKIGYQQDAKAWLKAILTYEAWFSRDYKKFWIKHPYKPFWEVQDEDMNISEYLFDQEFIDQANFKDFEDFKYETLTAEGFRTDKKSSEKKLTIGK